VELAEARFGLAMVKVGVFERRLGGRAGVAAHGNLLCMGAAAPTIATDPTITGPRPHAYADWFSSHPQVRYRPQPDSQRSPLKEASQPKEIRGRMKEGSHREKALKI
jgi:hypothetical protein